MVVDRMKNRNVFIVNGSLPYLSIFVAPAQTLDS